MNNRSVQNSLQLNVLFTQQSIHNLHSESGASFGWYIIGCAQLRNEFDKLNKQYTGRFNRTGPLESSN
ncbi:hypothetical protein T4B_1510 [Trichinella pseudospiralis]|uniref:Uncharacterized protein n=1 Tax=Trichinella pseudospiralis TaxID=6337 RepID=A0A0V1HFY1_TRIPS|nr:hypothetical protein T4B_1510 [Trichinella pseudospiralis]KRZ30747.1 hypothetical protein T4C_5225 [Trichinella pseudospiralis]